MEHTIELLVTVLIAVIGSNGLWTFIRSKSGRKTAYEKLLIGIGHAEIHMLAEKYLRRGGITAYELNDLINYQYEPYKQLGGNGTGETMVERVKRLPIISDAEAEKLDEEMRL